MNWFTKIFNRSSKKGIGGDTEWVSYFDGDSTTRVNKNNLLSNNKNWVFVSVDKIANAISGIKFQLIKTSKEGDDDEEVFVHPVLDFLAEPNKQMTFRDFIYTHIAIKEITGNAFWYKKEIVGSDNKEDLVMLNPTKVEIVVKDYEVEMYKFNKGVQTIQLAPETVLHDKYPNPSDQFRGKGTLEKVADWIDIDAFATEFNRTYFLKGATVGGFIETDEEDEERIRLIKLGMDEEYTGMGNAHKVGVLPKGAKFAGNKISMQDMQFVEADARYRDKILAAFGLPKSVVGIVDDVNRANAEASEYVFAKYTLEPKVRQFVEFLNKEILPMFDDSGNYYFSYKDFIPENRELIVKENQAGLSNQPYMTLNEVRLRDGLPAVAGGDVIYGNPLLEPVGKVEKSVKHHTARLNQKGFQKKTSRQKMNVSIDEALDKIVDKITDFGAEEIEKQLEESHKAFVSRVTEQEKILAKKFIEYNEKQKNEILRNLTNAIKKSFKNENEKRLVKEELLDKTANIATVINFAEPILKVLVREQITEEWIKQQFDGEPDLEATSVSKLIARSTKKMAKSYIDTSVDLVAKKIAEGIEAGEGINDITKRVQEVQEFSDAVRALRVARTETFYAANAGSREAYIQSGVVETVRWYTAQDERVCPFCNPLNGKVYGVKETLYKKGDTITGGDGKIMKADYRSIKHPPLHPACRCFIQPEKITI